MQLVALDFQGPESSLCHVKNIIPHVISHSSSRLNQKGHSYCLCLPHNGKLCWTCYTRHAPGDRLMFHISCENVEKQSSSSVPTNPSSAQAAMC